MTHTEQYIKRIVYIAAVIVVILSIIIPLKLSLSPIRRYFTMSTGTAMEHKQGEVYFLSHGVRRLCYDRMES